MTDSLDVLNMLKVTYSIYAWVAISLIAWFAYRLTTKGEGKSAKPVYFYSYATMLTIAGIAIHVLTYNQIPWVSIDLNRHEIKADQTFSITMKEHQFHLPKEKMVIACSQHVVFDLTTKDLTYGFGIFRTNGSMVTQMQVVPGSRNDLMWQFNKNGIYSIRSTEYSGPAGTNMYVREVIEVKGCAEDDRFSIGAGGKVS